MIQKLKDNWQGYLIVGIIGIWALVFFAIFSASARAGCGDVGIFRTQDGLCLARGLAGLSCYAGYLGVWTLVGGAVAQGKGRNPRIGWILGFTLQFIGCLGLMMLEPRRDLSGRMIGWDEYKHFSKEQREAIKPKPVPVTPEMRKRRKIVIVIAVVTALLFVFQVLKN